MARPLRIQYPGAFYHVTSRGDRKGDIVQDDVDRNAWLSVLGETLLRFGPVCHAYCLMTNHYHLLLETPQANLSRAMRHLNGLYTQKFNKRHGYAGHLFQGRYKAILVEKESYGVELARYIANNPVLAGMVNRADEYKWSSHAATAGQANRPEWLEAGWLLSQFGRTVKASQLKYRGFVEGAHPGGTDWTEEVRGQIILGGETFSSELRSRFGEQTLNIETERIQRLALMPTLTELLGSGGPRSLKGSEKAVYEAYAKYGYTLVEIGRHLGVHYTTVSKAVKRWEEK